MEPNMITPDTVWNDIAKIRAAGPLVHNITNFVVMNSTANALLAIGASPIMAHAEEEMEELAAIVGALVLNIGTLSTPWVQSMLKAGRAARARNIPVILDPVGAGASKLRTDAAVRILNEAEPTIVRGNASEIMTLASAALGTGADGGAKGVDSAHGSDKAMDAAGALAREKGCVTVVSGAVDIATDGSQTLFVNNGDPLMTRVTGMGCAATALIGAFAAVNPDALAAAGGAMAAMGVAGETAAHKADGPGSFQVHFLDALYRLGEADLQEHLNTAA